MGRRTVDSLVERIRVEWRSRLFEFGKDVLEVRREELHLTQTQVAKDIGIDPSTYSRIEGGVESPKDPPVAIAIARKLRLDPEKADAWFQLLYSIRAPQALSPESLFEKYGLSIHTSDFPSEEYWHIDAAKRVEVFADAAEMINSWAPTEERRRWKLQRINSFSEFPLAISGINRYVDHETDHAAMLILEWVRKNDSVRWHELIANLDRLGELAYLDARAEGLNVKNARALNTLLCYAHRFGPPALSDKVLRYALHLADTQPNAASNYILRDVLHCDVFRAQPVAEQRFYDWLSDAFRSPDESEDDAVEEAVPGWEILYFSSWVWHDQQHFLNAHLLPKSSAINQKELSRVLKQTLDHMNKHDLPALSTANYALVCIKLFEAERQRRRLRKVMNSEIVEELVGLAADSIPNRIRGIPVLEEIWGHLMRRIEVIAEAWGSADNAANTVFEARVDERWN